MKNKLIETRQVELKNVARLLVLSPGVVELSGAVDVLEGGTDGSVEDLFDALQSHGRTLHVAGGANFAGQALALGGGDWRATSACHLGQLLRIVAGIDLGGHQYDRLVDAFATQIRQPLRNSFISRSKSKTPTTHTHHSFNVLERRQLIDRKAHYEDILKFENKLVGTKTLPNVRYLQPLGRLACAGRGSPPRPPCPRVSARSAHC